MYGKNGADLAYYEKTPVAYNGTVLKEYSKDQKLS
jgi:hypothetical protein